MRKIAAHSGTRQKSLVMVVEENEQEEDERDGDVEEAREREQERGERRGARVAKGGEVERTAERMREDEGEMRRLMLVRRRKRRRVCENAISGLLST